MPTFPRLHVGETRSIRSRAEPDGPVAIRCLVWPCVNLPSGGRHECRGSTNPMRKTPGANRGADGGSAESYWRKTSVVWIIL